MALMTLRPPTVKVTAQRADAASACVAVGGVAGVELVAASDEAEAGVGERWSRRVRLKSPGRRRRRVIISKKTIKGGVGEIYPVLKLQVGWVRQNPRDDPIEISRFKNMSRASGSVGDEHCRYMNGTTSVVSSFQARYRKETEP
ncbi:uncharacterized protein A4U43_C05F20160 [Asparagus officinalis]|uniref:Uncharacterized protein n=1 Tax=Asparagus officinalis TaxID=4686 RepID=A0A5P1EWW7_ASPOF|nr:uncharacterized protein A4U43_C05F20160 [Asparagus officinalis]